MDRNCISLQNELKAYADQLASQTGIRDVQAFIGEAHSLYGEINGLKSEFTPVIDLVSGGKNALSANAKSLFEKYNLLIVVRIYVKVKLLLVKQILFPPWKV